MVITDSARDVLKEMLQQENKQGLTMDIIGSCCHSQLLIDFTDEIGEIINDISVLISESAREALDNITIDTREDGQLTFRSSNSCSGCSGCSSDCQ